MQAIAEYLTKYILAYGKKHLDYEVCKFGILMFLEVAVNLFIALTISITIGMFLYGIIFLILFSLFRAFAGGIHLKHFYSCTILSSVVFISVLLAVKRLYLPLSICCILSSILGVTILLLGPVDDENRKITNYEKKLFYIRLLVLVIGTVLVSFISAILQFKRLCILFCLTLGIFSIIQILGKIKNRYLYIRRCPDDTCCDMR